MKTLTILYDAQCPFCRRCRLWLEAQPKYLALRFVGRDSDAARQLWPKADTLEADELAVISDDGRLYRGDKAWIMCLYALRTWRPLALRLGRPNMIHFAGRAFAFISRRRHAASQWLLRTQPESLPDALQRLPQPPACPVAPAEGQAAGPCDADDADRPRVSQTTRDAGWRNQEVQS